jgi:hypothetical protein
LPSINQLYHHPYPPCPVFTLVYTRGVQKVVQHTQSIGFVVSETFLTYLTVVVKKDVLQYDLKQPMVFL